MLSKDLRIGLNRCGLTEDFDDEFKCIQYISKDEVPRETEFWISWMIKDHAQTDYDQTPINGLGEWTENVEYNKYTQRRKCSHK